MDLTVDASGRNGTPTRPGVRADTTARRFSRAASGLTRTVRGSLWRKVTCRLVANIVIIQMGRQISLASRSGRCLRCVTLCFVHIGSILLSIRFEGPPL